MDDPVLHELPTLHLDNSPPRPGCRLCITVPAKDEAELILDCLSSLERQVDAQGVRVDPDLYEVILLANNCADNTAALARDFARRHPRFRLHVCEITLPPPVACVGVARKLMMDEAARRLPPQGIIVMTDADTRVDQNWVSATLAAFDGGALAVGGRIIVPRGDRTGYRRIHLQDVTYRSLQMLVESMIDPDDRDPWPRHFQHYGPSLAVRADAYTACGGMPPVRFIEDAAFAWALERIDVQFVHDLAVRVYTSDRASDRIEGVTFSHALEEWTRMEEEGRRPVVFGLANYVQLCKWKVALRRAYLDRRIAGLPALFSLASTIGLSPRELQALVVRSATFGSLFQDVRERLARTPEFSDSPFPEAIRDLRRFTQTARTPLAFSTRPSGSGRPADRQFGRSRSGVR